MAYDPTAAPPGYDWYCPLCGTVAHTALALPPQCVCEELMEEMGPAGPPADRDDDGPDDGADGYDPHILII